MPAIPQPGHIIVSEANPSEYYRLERHIHKGRMSNAYEATDADGARVFLKSYTSPAPSVEWYKPFIKHVRELNNRIASTPAAAYCLKANSAFEACVGDCPYPTFFQVYDFIEGYFDLETLLRRATKDLTLLPWRRRLLVARVMLAGIKKLHAAGLVHCDLKPANIQMPPVNAAITFRPILVDTDYAIFNRRFAPWHGQQGYIGTINYHSPEHMHGGHVIPIQPSDVFTTALILYELLGQGNPYAAPTQEDFEKIILAGKPPPIVFQGAFTRHSTTVNLTNLLQQALSPAPEERPTADALHRAFLTAEPAHGDSGEVNTSSVKHAVFSRLTIYTESRQAIGVPLQKLVFTQNTVVGKSMLARLSNEARFASEPQFELSRDAAGNWYINPEPTSQNLTLLNSVVIEKRKQINNGDTISLAGRKSRNQALKMLVQIEH